MERNARLEERLAAEGVSAAALARAQSKATGDGGLAEALEAEAGLAPAKWAAVLADTLGLTHTDKLDGAAIEPELLTPVSMQYCRRNRVLPLLRSNGMLEVATSNPLVAGPLDDLQVLYGCEIEPVVVPNAVLTDGINRAFDRAASMSGSLAAEIEDASPLAARAAELAEAPDLLESDDEAPVIRLANSIIFQAAKDGASDIHIEPFERNTSVRFRIDGLLVEVLSPPRRVHPALVSRIKVMASMNIAERRLPQDGSIRTRVGGREVDIRVSTLPTSFGERVVMRLLDRSSNVLRLEELGMGGSELDTIRQLARQSHGILLVTGPTGSGKTTSLYALISEINSVEKNIITIEDPIEYQLSGVGQIQVNPKIDLTFANGLRSILRQDPDVIMVGEIRDAETARIAIQAALTGHLVFSTLHTNDSFSAVTRLLDMGVEPFLVSSSVIGIAAQRLVRRLCPKCSKPADATLAGLDQLGLTDAQGAREPGPGCKDCRGTGYRGRLAISELLAIDDEARASIMARSDAASLRDRMVARGMRTIRANGAAKVAAGLTSVAEILRVTTADLD
ncbi:MAG: general secretion pathway protein E [Hyphomicrobiaceae bacterium]